jgi:hypothetical protein
LLPPLVDSVGRNARPNECVFDHPSVALPDSLTDAMQEDNWITRLSTESRGNLLIKYRNRLNVFFTRSCQSCVTTKIERLVAPEEAKKMCRSMSRRCTDVTRTGGCEDDSPPRTGWPRSLCAISTSIGKSLVSRRVPSRSKRTALMLRVNLYKKGVRKSIVTRHCKCTPNVINQGVLHARSRSIQIDSANMKSKSKAWIGAQS